jgi:hypothetical protein
LAALTLAAALCGCADPSVFDHSQRWFSRPLDFTGRNSGYSFSEMEESRGRDHPVTANDLVSGNGACPGEPVSAPAAAGPPAPGARAAGAGASLGAPAPATGIALGMTECDVVRSVGAPSSVQIGRGPNGERTALLAFDRGPQAGTYRFQRGRLTAMDGVDAPAARPKVAERAKRARRPPPKTDQITTE